MIICNNCKPIVYWQEVNLRPLMKIYKKIEFIPIDNEIIPKHLEESNIRQFRIIIQFDKSDNILDVLTETKLSWNSINNNNICFGGNIYKRPFKKGFWILKAPCLNCYTELTKNTNDIEILKKACILSYL
jgi:hypothetical protein